MPLDRPCYVPSQRKILLPRQASNYERAHEIAHEQQHAARCRVWRLHERVKAWPYVSRIARLALEGQAALIALRCLDRTGLREPTSTREALRGLATYVRALTWL